MNSLALSPHRRGGVDWGVEVEDGAWGFGLGGDWDGGGPWGERGA